MGTEGKAHMKRPWGGIQTREVAEHEARGRGCEVGRLDLRRRGFCP